ncbi:MAG TPA: UDP-N-acetylglucosamine diphosphorylase [Opitutaceae bacterium]|nr:UDP-N-acetylglucosamine diphosphorylase [Opitutaceae bacterium]
MKASDFFTLPPSLAAFAPFFAADAHPWEWLKQIGPALAAADFTGGQTIPPGVHAEGQVFVHPTAQLPAYATLIGPIWIGPETKLLPGCYLRGNVIVGARCTVGHNAELKNALLMDRVQVPHRPYVGDSILGNAAHLGAGAVLSNLRLDQQPITVRLPSGTFETGLRKFGAILGDAAEVGCNAVLQPGTLLGPRALVMPTMAFGGYLPAATIARVRAPVSTFPRRD